MKPRCPAPLLVALAVLALHGCGPSPTASVPPDAPGVQRPLVAPATGPVTRVTDLNPDPVARQLVNAWGFTRLGAYVYFVASGAGVGQELWRTDGTAEGTTLVRDIVPGPMATEFSHLTIWRDRLYFLVSMPWGSLELYSTDGTSAGTRPHSVIPSSSHYTVLASLPTRQALCFALRAELGFSDPDTLLCVGETPPEQVRIPGPWEAAERESEGFSSSAFGVSDGVAYFNVSVGSQREEWRTDGTVAGTFRYFVPPSTGFTYHGGSMTPFQGALYFRAGASTRESLNLWRTDGTAQGTRLLKEFVNPGFCRCGLIPAGDTLWVPSYTPETGTELWKTDGTAEGTVLVKDLLPGPESGEPHAFTPFGDTTLFWARSPQGSGMWRTDGTPDGTTFITTAPAPMLRRAVGGILYFQSRNDDLELELWRTDGTAAGTVRVKGFTRGEASYDSPATMEELNGTLLLRGQDPLDLFGPWRSDGTPEGTLPLVDTPSTNSSLPRTLSVIDSRLYFYAFVAPSLGVWSSDGTAEGTVRLPVAPSSLSSRPGFVGGGGRTFFTGQSPDTGQELWVTDGTPAGTRLVRDLVAGPGHSAPVPRAVMGGMLYFDATLSRSRGPELWRTDGTAEGTRPVQELLPAGASTHYSWVLAAGDTLYFRARTAETGGELWRTDGTAGGTRMVRDLAPGTDSSEATPFALVGSTVYVTAGNALWKSDGTTEGTVLVKDLGTTLTKPVVVGSTLYFLTPTTLLPGNIRPGQLWKTDGTAEGTVRVRDARLVEQPTAMGGALYFFEEEPVGSHALWRTDGTEVGTWRVKALPRIWWADGTHPSEMRAVEPEGKLLFAAANEWGVEPWVSDGTPEGTGPLQDLYPGPAGSMPFGFTRLGDSVYFSANEPTHGFELWKVPVSELRTDAVPPELTCPGPVTADSANGDARAVDYPPATARDDRTASPVLTYSHPSGGRFVPGETAVTVTATDASGNTATCDFTVTVRQTPDAGTPDAGASDAGTPDSGTPDSGTPDSGTPDSGTPDADTPDGGTQEPGPSESGCGCGATDVGASWWALVLGAWLIRGRRAARAA